MKICLLLENYHGINFKDSVQKEYLIKTLEDE